MTKLNSKFQQLRLRYFPRWKDGANWKITDAPYTKYAPEHCICCKVRKTIFMGMSQDDPRFDETILHEIAHAVTTGKHGEKWFQRMEMVKRRALMLKDDKIVADVEADLKRVRDGVRDLGVNDLYWRARHHLRLA